MEFTNKEVLNLPLDFFGKFQENFGKFEDETLIMLVTNIIFICLAFFTNGENHRMLGPRNKVFEWASQNCS